MGLRTLTGGEKGASFLIQGSFGQRPDCTHVVRADTRVAVEPGRPTPFRDDNPSLPRSGARAIGGQRAAL
eukprot:5202363-Pyramimonas_sp.AAC.1